MIAVRLGDSHYGYTAGDIGAVRVVRRNHVSLDDCGSANFGIINEEIAISIKSGVERHSQKSLLVSVGGKTIADIQEGAGKDRIIPPDFDESGVLLQDEQALVIPRRGADKNRARQTGGYSHRGQSRCGGTTGALARQVKTPL